MRRTLFSLATAMRKAFFFMLLCLSAVDAWTKEAPTTILSLLEQHCLDCHDNSIAKGDLDLEALQFDLENATNRAQWTLIHDRIQKGEMPPPEKPELSPQERNTLTRALAKHLNSADIRDIRKNGRGPVRRLTRTEYEWRLRDLMHLPHLDVRDKLPADRDEHGFNKVARILDLSHVQLSGYLEAAEEALRQAVATGTHPPQPKQFVATGTDLFPALESFGNKEAMFFARDGQMVEINNATYRKMSSDERRDPTLELALFRSATWPYFGYPRGFLAREDGAYEVRITARAVRQLRDFRIVPDDDPLPMSFRARQPSGPDVSGDVRETGGWMDLGSKAKEFRTVVRLRKGETFEYSLLGLPVPFIRTDGGFYYDFPPMPPRGRRGAAIQRLVVKGPIAEGTWPPESHRVLFGNLSIKPAAKAAPHGVEVISDQPIEDAERLFRNFAARASHTQVEERDLPPFLKLITDRIEKGHSFMDSLLTGYKAFLCSPHVLCLESPRSAPDQQFHLATRLSHLLWNSFPDETLRQLAKEGRLSGEALAQQVDRMIVDERLGRFVEDFTSQWLDLDEVRRDIPDNRLYPEYRKDDYLVASMEKETLHYFHAMIRENLPASAVVDSDFTYVNDRLAEHYGLPRTQGSHMRKVALPTSSPYGGLLTQASILKLTSNGTTTSPVIRGAWVMRKIMGDPPPPPPKSVPAIEPDIRGASTIRQQLEQHTRSKSCAGCHARFDPIGFALENFDVMGAWRGRYRGMEKGEKITGIDPAGHPFTYYVGPLVEASGKLLDGRSFQDIRELKSLLIKDPRNLARNLLEHLTLYATGTPVRFSERPVIEEILDATEEDGYRIRDLLKALICSTIVTGKPS